MIEAIREINFPSYATLSKATVALNDMGDRTITTEVRIDGEIVPDFSYDWEIEFKGERYIQPLRKPQALKDNNSSKSIINLTFYHWAIYQLKRDFFVELASTQAGTAFADKYVAPLAVNLGEFIIAFNNVLSYYFPNGEIYAELNPDWEYKAEKQYVEISYSYLWDVLQKTYDMFGARWTIDRDDKGNYIIRFGYPAGELTHVFEYGFEGGLLKVERQVQDSNIRNKILGRGGSQNIPYLYFKDFDKYPQGGDGNQGMKPDPDAIPELSNIYFSELRDSNFRSYVQGWKTNPNRILVEGDALDEFDIERADSDYAYMRGATDEKFEPVEYVKDDDSIAEYGELVGKLENNEDIYPSLQGMEIHIIPPVGNPYNTRADEIVAVQEVVTDRLASDDEDAYKNDINKEMKSSTSHDAGKDTNAAHADTVTISSNEVEIPEGYEGTLFDLPNISYTLEFKERIKQYMQYKQYYEGDKLSGIKPEKNSDTFPTVSYKVIDVISNKEVNPINLPEGRYRIDYELKFLQHGLPLGIIHAQQTPNGLGQTERVKIYWFKRVVTTSATLVCKSFNGDVILNKVNGVSISRSVSVGAHGKESVSISGDSFTVPEQGAIMVDVPIKVTPAATTTYSEKTIKVINTETNEIVPASNIPQGKYRLLIEVTLTNDSSSEKTLTVEVLPAYLYFVDNTAKWEPTFDVWIKNIFNTKKSSYSSEAAYVEAVWSPLRTEDEMAVTFSSGNLSGHDNWEFRVKKDGIAYDNSKVIVDANGNEVRSEWRLTLIKSDAELETMKKYVPYKDFNAAPGDMFYFTGIFLPHQYVLSAEEKLTKYKEDNLFEVKDIKPQWLVSIDKVRAHQGDAIRLIDSLSVGSVITLKDKRFLKTASELQRLQTITYEWQEGVLLPNVDVVLSDKITTTLSTVAMLQGKVESLVSQARSLSDIEMIVRKLGDMLYLRKDGFDDTSYSPTKFAKKVSSNDFNPGAIGGTGWGLYQDQFGQSVMEVDKLFIRNEMHVNSLVVNQIAALGGTKILSAADMIISTVEPVVLENDVVGDRCFFDTKGASKANLFKVDDIAYSNMFDSENAELKYYKRRVIEVGENYITLSTSDCDGEGTPQEGDVIVQLGNFTDKTRQSFIIIDPLNGGKIEVFSGVDSFSLSERNMIGLGANPETNESFLYGYGDMFFGERSGLGHYISFDKSTGKLSIRAEVKFEAGSSGIENIDGLPEAISSALSGIEVGGQNLLRNSGFTGNYLSDEIADEDVLDAATELFSNPLAFWSIVGQVEVETLEGVAVSGKGVSIASGSKLSQDMYYKAIEGEGYVLSFRASAITSGETAQMIVSFGGSVREIEIPYGWDKYAIHLTASSSTNKFSIETSGGLRICDIQLERGTLPTAWGNSPFDNSSDKAYYQSLKYLQDAFEGATEIAGGLVLTEQINVGDYDKENKAWKKMSAGMSGVYDSDSDVAFWAGGSFAKALETVMKYEDDPTYQPTQEELAAMANFVVTHGGRTILNEAIIRGTIYADKGRFGDMNIVSNHIYEDSGLEGTKMYDSTERHTLKLYSDFFEMTGYNGDRMVEQIRISPYYYGDRYDMSAMIDIYARKNYAAIAISEGHIAGLRHDVSSVSSDNVNLGPFSPYVIILTTATSGNKSVVLPRDAEKGTTFHIINPHKSPIIIGMGNGGSKIVFNTETQEQAIDIGWIENAPYKIEAYFDGSMWYLCPIK